MHLLEKQIETELSQFSTPGNLAKPLETSFRMEHEVFEEEYADNFSDVPSDAEDKEGSDSNGGKNIERGKEEDSFPQLRRNHRVRISSSSDDEESDEDPFPPPRKNRRVLRIPLVAVRKKKKRRILSRPQEEISVDFVHQTAVTKRKTRRIQLAGLTLIDHVIMKLSKVPRDHVSASATVIRLKTS